MRGTSPEEDEERRRKRWSRRKRRTFTTSRGAAEELRHVASIRSSPDESLLKIFTDARDEKKIRGRIGDEREREPSRPAVLIWPSERDDTASRHGATSGVDPGAIPRERTSDFISDLRRSVVRDSDTRYNVETFSRLRPPPNYFHATRHVHYIYCN